MAHATTPAPVRIVALGDSLTAGLGLPEREGFVPRLQAALAPKNVPVEIVNAGVSGDTATGGQKSAKLETGAVVRVPLFLNEGEVIRVDTRTGSYLSRAKG